MLTSYDDPWTVLAKLRGRGSKASGLLTGKYWMVGDQVGIYLRAVPFKFGGALIHYIMHVIQQFKSIY